MEEFEKLKQIIADVLSVDPEEVKMETTFMDDLGADSLDVYQIIMGIEEEFDIEVSDDGVNWTKIIEHETDGITPGYEYMECDAAGKYVRLYGYGNSVNEWNSILEFNVIDTRDW